jgi:HSP20 family protein
MTHLRFNSRPVTKTFDNLFDELFNVNWNNQVKENTAVPPVNIFETKDAFHLELNVPGRNREDFKVNIENGLLTISYEKPEQKSNDDYTTVRREFDFKSFTRTFSIDKNIDAENIQAKYENGLLKFLLPKKEQPKKEAKQISVQ